MVRIICLLGLIVIPCVGVFSQDSKSIDSALANKISISGFCLCQTTLPSIQNQLGDLKIVRVEEMDLPLNCYGQDSRYEAGKGYYSEKYPGLIFQKDLNSDGIGKIRLTKRFKGSLPDGNQVDLENLTLRDIFKMYPYLEKSWQSRGCSNYWNFGNDTLSFFVKIDSTKKSQFPIDEQYYFNKPVEAIDLKVSCYQIFEKPPKYKQLPNSPLYFIDSVNVTVLELQKYKSEDIAAVSVYKDSNAINLVGEQGRLGAIYVETKSFARNKYWNFFKSKSDAYFRVVPTIETDSIVSYILNGEVLKKNYEYDLSILDDKTFIDLQVIDKKKLEKEYKIFDKEFGVLIKTGSDKSFQKH